MKGWTILAASLPLVVMVGAPGSAVSTVPALSPAGGTTRPVQDAGAHTALPARQRPVAVISTGRASRERAGMRGYPVRVYFSRHPVSENQYCAVFAVRRVSPTLGVATYAIGQLLAGPTRAETKAGYYTEFTDYYHGPSTCGPAGFTIRLDRRGDVPEPGTATLRLCRRIHLPGIGTSARMAAEARATLRQFPHVRRVVILNAAGACFGDESGRNTCLRPPS